MVVVKLVKSFFLTPECDRFRCEFLGVYRFVSLSPYYRFAVYRFRHPSAKPLTSSVMAGASVAV